MGDTLQSDQVEVRTELVIKEKEESSKTSHSGDNGNTITTRPDIERLENLSKSEALAQVHEELANLLVVYQNLGGKITALTLPEGKNLLGGREILVLPARKDNSGTYSLRVPENQ